MKYTTKDEYDKAAERQKLIEIWFVYKPFKQKKIRFANLTCKI